VTKKDESGMLCHPQKHNFEIHIYAVLILM